MGKKNESGLKLSKQSKKAFSVLADRLDKEIASANTLLQAASLRGNYAHALRVQARIDVAHSIVNKLRAVSKCGVLL